jgi:hypothetical protein
MRYTGKYLQLGDIEEVTKFLWWPVTVVNLADQTYETRWLEKTTIVYRYEVRLMATKAGKLNIRQWVPIRFRND